MTERERALVFNNETKNGIEIIFAELNQGQRKKLMNNPNVKPILDRYHVTDREES